MKMTDAKIQRAVLQELEWDTRVRETEVGVTVSEGVVTLSGQVNSWAKRIAAQEAAHRVAAVRDVANDLEVSPPAGRKRTDAQIAKAVRHALEWDLFVPQTKITTTVSKGVVTLEGTVDYWSQRQAAEEAIRNLAGITKVENEIEVEAPEVERSDVRQAIQAALDRRAEREASQIKLDVHGSRVSVSGVVHSASERKAVLGAARGTPGVSTVDDLLRVEPF